MKHGAVDYTAAMYRPQQWTKLQEAQRYLRLPSLRSNLRAKDRDRLAEKKKREEKGKKPREKIDADPGAKSAMRRN
jgi:hypothetical protein